MAPRTKSGHRNNYLTLYNGERSFLDRITRLIASMAGNSSYGASPASTLAPTTNKRVAKTDDNRVHGCSNTNNEFVEGYWKHDRYYGSWKPDKYLFPIDSVRL
jgi:hypothetical protein